MRVVGVIPARLHSTRLPRKLLLNRTGKSLLQHTWERARQSRSLSDLLIATDSQEIATEVAKFGGRVELTGEHPSGTDRIAEVVRRSVPDADVIVNIQGDEPEIDPAQIETLISAIRNSPHAEMSTLATPIEDENVLASSSCVKVVCAADGRALYFSRSPIPFVRDHTVSEILANSESGYGANSPWLLHLGIYAYRRSFLLAVTEMPPSRLEQLEKLEQLRALEAGACIQVAVVRHRSVGIDTPEDYARFVERVQGRA